MTRDAFFELILKTAEGDERVRAVTMEGSSVTSSAVMDEFSDFDLTFFVRDIRAFPKNRTYMEAFGDILILQMPDDWYNAPYDYDGDADFAYLCQYKDGNRLDLTLVDVGRIEAQQAFAEPRRVLINKDAFGALRDVDSLETLYTAKPGEMEFQNTCNEFRWISLYVSKGICRQELYYAKQTMDQYAMDMFMKMLNFKVAVDNDFHVTTGKCSKYMKRYLTAEELERFHGVFSDGSYAAMREKLLFTYDYFEDLAEYVAGRLGYAYDKTEAENVRAFLVKRFRRYDGR